jgi:DNA-binding response OmpR family regulator
MRLLIVEDNARLGQYLRAALAARGFVVDLVQTAGDAEAALAGVGYNAMILDLGLPDEDGVSLLKKLRQQQDMRPVIILTARDSIKDLVGGLNEGADDYLCKPFDLEELIARLRALLRRPGQRQSVIITEGDIRFDTVNRELRVHDQTVWLSRREIDAFELLLQRSGRVVSKDALQEVLYAFGSETASNAVEVLVHRLRKRLLEAGAADATIHTIRGVGYMLTIKAGKAH